MATVEAQPFFHLADWLESSPSPPGIVVENVVGLKRQLVESSVGLGSNAQTLLTCLLAY